MTDISFTLTLLVILSLWIKLDIFIYGKKQGFINFVVLLRLVFLLVYPYSGLCHLFFLNDERGFFDSYKYSLLFNESYINLFSFLQVFLFYVFMSAFQNTLKPIRLSGLKYSIFQNKTYLVYGVAFTLIGVFASVVLSFAIDTSIIERGRELPKGAAKFVFISTWFGWGITLVVYSLLKKYRLPTLILVFLFYGSILLIVLNVMWMGGRSAAILLNLPLIFIFAFYKRKLFKKLILTLLIPFLLYISYVSDVRKEGYQNSETPFNQVLDWEFGRFSMVSYSIDYTMRKDFFFGSTYADAILKSLGSPFYILGLGAKFVGDSEGSTVHEIGKDLANQKNVSYIVPGAIPEAYMNFGVFGVILLGVLFGVLSKFIDNMMFFNYHRPFHFIFYAYLGSVLCFNFLNSTFFAFLNYLMFTGAPLTLAVFASVFIGFILKK